VFWRLTAWHEITNQQRVMPIESYDKRAKDIYDVIRQTNTESGDASLCWAADKTLLDILIDEYGCTTELFSNILSTYHRFSWGVCTLHTSCFPKTRETVHRWLSRRSLQGLCCIMLKTNVIANLRFYLLCKGTSFAPFTENLSEPIDRTVRTPLEPRLFFSQLKLVFV
jgi:hypothetical protein